MNNLNIGTHDIHYDGSIGNLASERKVPKARNVKNFTNNVVLDNSFHFHNLLRWKMEMQKEVCTNE